MGIPAQYKIDAQSVYVSLYDTAWDHDAVAAERKALADGEHHAFDEWMSGVSRYDSTAMPEKYLKSGEEPIRFHIRRLGYVKWAFVRDIDEKGNLLAPYEAFRMAVTRVDGCNIPGVVFPGTGRGELDAQAMEEIAKVIPRNMLEDVGRACIRSNADLRPLEKKASGS